MPKLPADLPENWTRGQIVSPNGTETGLTEQHGYNYLMKQVNDTQTEVNGINEALPDVAQQATVEEINNKIGTEGDADTQPTLFGRLAQLKKVLLEKLAEVLTKVTGIDGKIGTIGDSESTDTLFGRLKKVLDSVDEKMYIPSDTVVSSLNTTNVGTSGSGTKLVLKRKAEYSGTVRIKIGSAKGGFEDTFGVLAFAASSLQTSNINTQDYIALFTAMATSEGTQISKTFDSYSNNSFISGFFSMVIDSELNNIIVELNVKKGEYYYVISSWSSGNSSKYLRDVTLCYDIA